MLANQVINYIALIFSELHSNIESKACMNYQ